MVTTLLTVPLYAGIFFVMLAVALGPAFIRTVERPASDTATDHDRGSRWVINVGFGGGYLAGVGLVYVLPSFGISWRPHIVFWIGIALIVLGGGVRQYAVRTLNRYFTNRVTIQPEQTVIDAGPYRWVRHPAYTGSLITLLGIGVVLANWASILVMVVALGSAYSYRIPVEEQTLKEQLGDPYQAYMERTPSRIIPYVW